ncbi:DUF3783 domain-containing protein [Candidatus Haliotispira prima]|uniref:DUF3783 domain-containing protein n=1 Tax=Candidatus Haliotispira prima TaxID=3034016 RepID=A0ABY8MDU2_9SPIO|nr:DUF3783 domain-containing protein [Candidatus Haliotispira prima]
MPIILCSGFDKNLYSTVRIEGGIDRNTPIITLKKGDLALSLETIVRRACDLESDTEDGRIPESLYTMRYVILSGSRNDLDDTMAGFKKTYKLAAGSAIFAMLTETAKTWTLEDYLNELAREHEEMRQYRTNQVNKGNPMMLHEDSDSRGAEDPKV